MPGVVRQPRIADARHRPVALEPERERRRRLLGAIEADGEGPQAAQGQERLHHAGHRAVGDASAIEAGEQLRPLRHQGAEEQVGVAADELRGAVEDDVGAELERPLAQRRRERVVDDDERAARVGDLGGGADVGDTEQGVRRRLQPQQRRPVAPGRDRVEVGDVDELGAQPAGDDPGIRRQRLQERRGGRHARGEREARAALERPEGLLERGPGRVALAGVDALASGPVDRAEADRAVHRATRFIGSPGGDDERVRPQCRLLR